MQRLTKRLLPRRQFCAVSAAAAFSLGTGQAESEGSAVPLKFGHRQANMVPETGPIVFEVACRIPGLSGVELQMLGRAIRAAELLGASVVLVALFDANCPVMDNESSYGPVVELLQKVSSEAGDAGVVLGLETSLTPVDDRKFVDLVGRREVGMYYDATNKEVAYPGQSVPGIQLLADRIVQVHLKNEDRLLAQVAKVNWVAALQALRANRYQAWYVFETAHSDPDQCIQATGRNISFVRQHSA